MYKYCNNTAKKKNKFVTGRFWHITGRVLTIKQKTRRYKLHVTLKANKEVNNFLST